MFKLLLETLKNESEATKGMFFAAPEPDLTRAYQEGREARKNKLPLSSNPYPESKTQDSDIGLYTMNLCWSEGFLDIYISEE
jgi:hypothetical protein